MHGKYIGRRGPVAERKRSPYSSVLFPNTVLAFHFIAGVLGWPFQNAAFPFLCLALYYTRRSRGLSIQGKMNFSSTFTPCMSSSCAAPLYNCRPIPWKKIISLSLSLTWDMFPHAWSTHGWVSAAGAVVGTWVERVHELPSASCSWVQPPLKPVWVTITQHSGSQAEDPATAWLRCISGRPAAIAGRRQARNTLRETDGRRDSHRDAELAVHSWKDQLHVKRGHPVECKQPTLG